MYMRGVVCVCVGWLGLGLGPQAVCSVGLTWGEQWTRFSHPGLKETMSRESIAVYSFISCHLRLSSTLRIRYMYSKVYLSIGQQHQN